MDFTFTDEQLAFRDLVLKFSQNEIAPYAEEYDEKGEFCWEAWKKMGEFGLLGLHFPEEYGGAESDVVTACLASEALAEITTNEVIDPFTGSSELATTQSKSAPWPALLAQSQTPQARFVLASL